MPVSFEQFLQMSVQVFLRPSDKGNRLPLPGNHKYPGIALFYHIIQFIALIRTSKHIFLSLPFYFHGKFNWFNSIGNKAEVKVAASDGAQPF